MIIQSSNVNLYSSRQYSQTVRGSRRITEWQASNPANCRVSAVNYSYRYEEESMYNNYNDFAKNTKNAKSQGQSQQTEVPAGLTTVTQQPDSLKDYLEYTRRTFLSLLELLFHGRKMIKPESGGTTLNLRAADGSFDNGFDKTNIWNRVTEENYTLEESEKTTFEGIGTAITADGRCLSFDVSVSLSRNFCRENDMTSVEQYDRVLTDPLVIQLDSSPVSLSAQTFFFDIDNDGEKEELSKLSSSSGFLALDKDGDGKIGSGSELFGTETGNGFRELAAYDNDGNGWIDEADEVFSKLKVWVKDEEGRDCLLSLKGADVGAIYLGSAQSEFSLTDSDNMVNGVVRRSGIFLHESGSAGTVCQVDLAEMGNG